MSEHEINEPQPYFDADIAQLIDDIEVDEASAVFKQETKRLVFKALEIISAKYGRDGEGAKPFHDASHTKEFIFDAVKAFDAIQNSRPDLNLTAKDKLILIRSSSWHDIEQDKGTKFNEQESANLLNENQGEDEVKLLSERLIMTTVFDFANHRQNLTRFGEATTVQEALEQCMALADLAALGHSERQHWRGNRLAHELGKTNDPKAWFDIQLGFLRKQKTYLESSFGNFPIAVLYPDIDQNIELYKKLSSNYDYLIAEGITIEQIMSKNKKESDLVKQALDKLR